MEKDKNETLKELVAKFNTIVSGMVNHITEYYGDPNTICISLILENIIKYRPETLITYFLMNIFKNDEYRLNILKQNDDFFINHNYDNLTGGDDSKISKVFEFKNLWKKVDGETKNFIKKSMLALVKICQSYVLTL